MSDVEDIFANGDEEFWRQFEREVKASFESGAFHVWGYPCNRNSETYQPGAYIEAWGQDGRFFSVGVAQIIADMVRSFEFHPEQITAIRADLEAALKHMDKAKMVSEPPHLAT